MKVSNTAFKPLVREAKFDVAELAIVTFLQAKNYGKPYTLIPVMVLGRGQHHTIAFNPQRGELKAADLTGKRVGVRAYTQTTGAWARLPRRRLRRRYRQSPLDHVRRPASRRIQGPRFRHARSARQDAGADVARRRDRCGDRRRYATRPAIEAAHFRRRCDCTCVGGNPWRRADQSYDGGARQHRKIATRYRSGNLPDATRKPASCAAAAGRPARSLALRHRGQPPLARDRHRLQFPAETHRKFSVGELFEI